MCILQGHGGMGATDGAMALPSLLGLWTFTWDLNQTAGAENVLEYKGLYNGSSPNPTQSPGVILMESSITFYAADSSMS